MTKTANVVLMVGFVAAIAIAVPCAAEGDGSTVVWEGIAAPSAFGANNQWTIVHACEFDEETQATTASGNVLGTGYVHPVQAFSSWWTQLEFPSGTEVLQVVLIAYDFNATEDVHLDFYAVESAQTGTAPFMTGWGPIQTTGQPLYTTVALNLTATPVLLRAQQDLNLDGIANWVSYHLSVWTDNATNASVQFYGAAVEWRRIICPAPAIATFPDVAPTFWAFQEIEALAAAGITLGFPDGTFRPTTAVTRAQMATFLARALGLHWPS